MVLVFLFICLLLFVCLFYVSTVLFLKVEIILKYYFIVEDNASEMSSSMDKWISMQLEKKIFNITVFLYMELEPKMKLM